MPLKRQRHLRAHANGFGANPLLLMAIIVIGLMFSVLAIDIPFYYVAQNQLQTSVNAAALAGAAKLPIGEAEAESEAAAYAAENLVMGSPVTEDELTYTYEQGQQYTFKVSGEKQIPTIMSKFICGMKNAVSTDESTEQSVAPSGGNDNCNYMTVYASAKAVPAARDTIIVIDNSSSMNFLGNNRPLKDVRDSATAYVNRVLQMESGTIDRIGLVKFAYDASLLASLKSTAEDPNFSTLKSKISGINIYNAQGWNTNYEAPLIKAIDELQNRGRKNADKLILFMTDGYPNLPGPPSFYNNPDNKNIYTPYATCYKVINRNPDLKNLCYIKNGKKTCPVFPDQKVTAPYIWQAGQDCGMQYTNYMISAVNAQVQRAVDKEIIIHTISMINDDGTGGALDTMQRMRKEPNWTPALLELMAEETGGEQYSSDGYDPQVLNEVYDTIAKDVRMRLAN